MSPYLKVPCPFKQYVISTVLHAVFFGRKGARNDVKNLDYHHGYEADIGFRCYIYKIQTRYLKGETEVVIQQSGINICDSRYMHVALVYVSAGNREEGHS